MTPGAAEIVAAIRRWQDGVPPPLVVAIDGYGASGKTTVALEVAAALDATLAQTDDYFNDRGSNDDARPMGRYYDWDALRRESLEPMLASGIPLILVDGVSSAAPALADLVTHAVFVATPEPVRLTRLRARVTDEDWDEEWLDAERVYFGGRPPKSFDLVVPGTAD